MQKLFSQYVCVSETAFLLCSGLLCPGFLFAVHCEVRGEAEEEVTFMFGWEGEGKREWEYCYYGEVKIDLELDLLVDGEPWDF